MEKNIRPVWAEIDLDWSGKCEHYVSDSMMGIEEYKRSKKGKRNVMLCITRRKLPMSLDNSSEKMERKET